LDRFPNIKVKAFYPDTQSIEEYVTSNGINAFYQSLDLRKSCCHIRKVEPLRRALAGVDVWITGLRAAQSVNRLDMVMAEWDHTHQLIKFNPVLFWSLDEVKNYLIENQIPYNALHDKGFPSIGCAPCTRAIKEGEDLRAGRWWWEHNTTKECGLHASYGSAK
jgi:phosphoadenosine phosphosulfate reductase